MKSYILEIHNDSIADKVLWMLEHFKSDGLVIKEKNISDIDIKSSISQSVKEINMVKKGDLKARPIEDLLNEL